MYNSNILLEEEYEISCEQYVSARLAYEKRCGSLSDMYLWCAVGFVIIALPLFFLRSIMNISYGIPLTVFIILCGVAFIVQNAFLLPHRVSLRAKSDYENSPFFKDKHKISFYRDTFTYENSCEHIEEYYSKTSAVIETKASVIIAVDTLGSMIVITKNRNENTLRSILRERYRRRYMK